jgi:RHS repeat-associated protein
VTVNASGAVDSWRDYYPYGMTMEQRSGAGSADRRYQFTGHEKDALTGLTYAGARTYLTEEGIWMQVDPLAGKYPDWSPYNYVLGNPLRYVDPDGMRVSSDEEKERYQNANTNLYVGSQRVQQGLQLIKESFVISGSIGYGYRAALKLGNLADIEVTSGAMVEGSRDLAGNTEYDAGVKTEVKGKTTFGEVEVKVEPKVNSDNGSVSYSYKASWGPASVSNGRFEVGVKGHYKKAGGGLSIDIGKFSTGVGDFAVGGYRVTIGLIESRMMDFRSIKEVFRPQTP